MKNITIKVLLIIIALITTLNLKAQEDKKKRPGLFKKFAQNLREEFIGAPGRITSLNIVRYYKAFTNEVSQDSLVIRMQNDSLMHIGISTKLSHYDPVNEGFYISQGLHKPPKLITDSDTYYFIFKNLKDYRFLKISEEEIMKKVNPFDLSSEPNFREFKKGIDNIEAYTYFLVDTAYTNMNGAKIIIGDIHKIRVKWRKPESPAKEIAIIDTPAKNTPIPFYRTLKDTKLHNLFSDYPFYTDEDWPKVAITFTRFPEIYGEDLFFMADRNSGQFEMFLNYPIVTLRATIWEDENTKIEIPEFTYLPCDFDTYGIPTINVLNWGVGSVQALAKENTGYQRTDGPLPPQHFLPETPYKHQTYFERSSPGLNVVSDILNKIDFDWNKIGDRRVWFNIED